MSTKLIDIPTEDRFVTTLKSWMALSELVLAETVVENLDLNIRKKYVA